MTDAERLAFLYGGLLVTATILPEDCLERATAQALLEVAFPTAKIEGV